VTKREFATYRLSTQEHPERDHIAYWRELHQRQIVRAELEALSDAPFRADVTLRTLPGLNLLSGMAGSLRNSRNRSLITDGNTDFGLMWIRSGDAIQIGRGKDVKVNAGNGLLRWWAEPYMSITPKLSHWTSVTIPYAALAALVPNVNDAVMRVIPASHALSLLTGYVDLLMDSQGLATPELNRSAVSHVYDLAALVIGASRDAAAVAEGRGVRAARLHAVKADIARYLDRHDLSVGTVAARQGVRVRYVQRLFETEGMTFSQFVLSQRLLRAHRLLTDRRYDTWKVSAVAFAVGFADLSYFNRAFRKLHGQTPSDVREMARRMRQG